MWVSNKHPFHLPRPLRHLPNTPLSNHTPLTSCRNPTPFPQSQQLLIHELTISPLLTSQHPAHPLRSFPELKTAHLHTQAHSLVPSLLAPLTPCTHLADVWLSALVLDPHTRRLALIVYRVPRHLGHCRVVDGNPLAATTVQLFHECTHLGHREAVCKRPARQLRNKEKQRMDAHSRSGALNSEASPSLCAHAPCRPPFLPNPQVGSSCSTLRSLTVVEGQRLEPVPLVLNVQPQGLQWDACCCVVGNHLPKGLDVLVAPPGNTHSSSSIS